MQYGKFVNKFQLIFPIWTNPNWDKIFHIDNLFVNGILKMIIFVDFKADKRFSLMYWQIQDVSYCKKEEKTQ